ncbi:MAG: hypothetical protein NVSMB40_06990 [Aquirhabdus sp.]
MTTAKTTMTVSEIIARVGETDQIFLTAPTPMLALERAQLRQMLVALSNNQSEQLYFLGEAAVILELADAEAEDQATHVLLAAQLASVYLQFNQVTPQKRYLTVVGQILRSHSNAEYSPIFLGLARMDAAQGKTALTKHWLIRWLKVFNADMDSPLISIYPEFKDYLSEDWFQQFITDAQNPQRSIPNPITSVHS